MFLVGIENEMQTTKEMKEPTKAQWSPTDTTRSYHFIMTDSFHLFRTLMTIIWIVFSLS